MAFHVLLEPTVTQTERAYYAVLALYTASAWCIVASYPIFLRSRGLDLFEVNAVLAVFMIANVLFEVPTGAVADLFGRKISFVLAGVTRTLAYALYSFAEGFGDCVVAEVIDALGQTFASGALDAWAVDGLRAEGDRRPLDRMFSHGQMISRGMMIASGVAAGYVADVDLTLPWLLGASGFGATTLLALAVMRDDRPPKRPPLRSLHRSLGDTVRDGLGAVRSSVVLRGLLLRTFGVGFAVLTIAMTWPPRLKDLSGEGFWLLGWVWALLNLTALAGGALAGRLLPRFGRARVLCAAQLCRASGFAIGALATGFSPALGGLVLQELGSGVDGPGENAWLNDHVESRRRATVLSVHGMAFTLGGSLGLVALGLVAERAGIPTAWLASAAVFAVLAPGYLRLGRLEARERARDRARDDRRA